MYYECVARLYSPTFAWGTGALGHSQCVFLAGKDRAQPLPTLQKLIASVSVDVVSLASNLKAS